MLARQVFSAAQLAQEVKLTLPLSAVLRLAHDEPALIGTLQVTTSRRDLPAIGAAFEGGEFAGVTLADDALTALVLLPGDMDPDTWAKYVEWVKASSGSIPSRFDHLVLLKNMRSRFRTDECYWGEEVAGYPEYAWYQGFSFGYQDLWRKSLKRRGVAVRRVPI